MDVLDAVKGRRSIRRFRSAPIPEAVVPALEEALIEAPSAGNLQARRFYFVFREETRMRLAEAAYRQSFIHDAPLAVVCCADLKIAGHYRERGRSLYCLQDVAASIQNLMLVAHSRGLGSAWVGAIDEQEVARVLNLPEHVRPLAVVPVGYPEDAPKPPGRVHRERAIFHIL